MHMVEYWHGKVGALPVSVPKSGFEGTTLEAEQASNVTQALDALQTTFPGVKRLSVNRLPSRCTASDFGLGEEDYT